MEGLWVAAGRNGCAADFLKGLIKLAAAGVKAREGQPVGVQRHSRRAAELFCSVADRLPAGQKTFAGLVIADLILGAESLFAPPIVDDTPSVAGRSVLSWRLSLVADR